MAIATIKEKCRVVDIILMRREGIRGYEEYYVVTKDIQHAENVGKIIDGDAYVDFITERAGQMVLVLGPEIKEVI